MKSRHYFLDNMRTFMVFLVVASHSGLPYVNPALYKGPLCDSHLIVVDGMLRLWDVILMPILFMVSGYFLYPSLRRANGLPDFVLRKAYRLGLPFLYGILIFTALNRYICANYSNSFTGNFGEYWFDYYIKGNMVADHMWFLSTLFFLTVMGAIVLRTKIIVKSRDKAPVPLTSFFLLFIASCLSFLFMHQFFADNHWIQWGHNGILMMQPTRVAIYVCFFLFGILCWVKGWSFQSLNERLSIGKSFFLAAVASAFMELFSLFYYNHTLFAESFVHRALNAILHNGCLIFSTLFLFVVFYKYLNIRNKATDKLSQSSLSMYIVHFPIVSLVQTQVRHLNSPAIFKYMLATTLSILISYIVGYYILRPLLTPDKLFGKVIEKFGSTLPETR